MNIICNVCRVVTPDNPSKKCPAHRQDAQRARDRLRAPYKAAKYNHAYRKVRAATANCVAAQGGYRCARGGEWVTGTTFDLDHMPDGSLMPSCPFHNRAAH